MRNTYLLIGVILIILIGVVIFLIKKNTTIQMSTKTQQNNTAQNENTIEIKDFTFIPSKKIVEVGSQIIWKNMDNAPHSITSNDGIFDSGELQPGENGSITFRKKGTFIYHCSIHPDMKATVVVE